MPVSGVSEVEAFERTCELGLQLWEALLLVADVYSNGQLSSAAQQ